MSTNQTKRRLNRFTAFAAALALAVPLAGIGPQAPAAGAAAAAAPKAACQNNGAQLVKKMETHPSRKHFEEGPYFDTIQFLSGNIGRVAGNGFMIGTSDGGCSWQTIYTGEYNFHKLEFVTNSVGYVIGTKPDSPVPILLKTTDGGSTYQPLKNAPYGTLDIDFSDQKNGFLYTYGLVYRTSDGGTTWTRIPTPANSRGALFTDADHGWTVQVRTGGYNIMKTENGGKTWYKTLVVDTKGSNPAGKLYSKDGKSIYALLYGDSGMSQISYSLYHSAEGGKNWVKLTSISSSGGGPAPGDPTGTKRYGGPEGFPGNLEISGDAAYLVAGGPATEKVSFARSLNNGKTWSNLKATLPGYEGVISFPAEKKGFAIVAGSSSIPAVYSTEDGGLTWNKKLSFPAPIQ